MIDFFKAFDNSEPRGPDGRWTGAEGAGAAAMENTVRGHDAGVLDNARQIGAALVAGAKLKAQQFAATTKRAIVSTKLHSIAPTFGGGLQLVTEHNLGEGQGTMRGVAQIHPHMLGTMPQAQRALSAVHARLISAGIRSVPMRRNPLSLDFSNNGTTSSFGKSAPLARALPRSVSALETGSFNHMGVGRATVLMTGGARHDAAMAKKAKATADFYQRGRR